MPYVVGYLLTHLNLTPTSEVRTAIVLRVELGEQKHRSRKRFKVMRSLQDRGGVLISFIQSSGF